jgi:hypothetical protein
VAGVVVVAGLVALAAWLWTPGRALGPAEEPLVGTWAIQLPPDAPPNAVQQVFELQPRGRLVRVARPVDSTAGGGDEPMSGTWSVEDGYLLTEAVGPGPNSLAERILGGGPARRRAQDRFRIIEQTAASLKLQGPSGAVLRLERVPE